MIGRFVTGFVWGAVVAGAGLAVISQVAPLPVPAGGAEVPAAAVPPVAVPDALPEAAPDTAPEPDVELVDPPAEVAVAAPEPEPEGVAAALDASPEAMAAPAPALPDPAPALLDPVPERMATPAPAEDVANAPSMADEDAPAALPVPTVPPPDADAAPAGAEPPPVVMALPAEPLLENMTAPPVVTPEPEPPAIIILDSEPEMGAAPKLIVPDGKPLTDLDAPGQDGAVPQIGATPDTEVAEVANATPLNLFSRPFDNPDAKPLFVLLLADDGAPDTDRETLAALPFPITFVIDPMAPNAAEAAAIYRKAGQEVMMQTAGIPTGATAADLEQSYQAMDIALPEAVAVLGAAGLSQDTRDLAAAVVPILVAQGRGVVTMERGLNAVDQAARRAGLPQATVFRMLDAADETVPVIRRYLDRAAFRAAQAGDVVVLGSTKPDTIAAILQWTVEGRAASVAMAPVSAVLQRQP